MNKNYDVSFLHEQLSKNPVAVHEFYQWAYDRYFKSNGLTSEEPHKSVERYFTDLPYELQYGMLISFFNEKGKIMLLSSGEAIQFFERMFTAIENEEEYPNPDRELMSVGANAIFQERIKQVQKHGYTIDYDKQYNDGELIQVAVMLLTGNLSFFPKWLPVEMCERLMKHPDRERKIIAGALIAAHLDLEAEEKKINNK